ncbi:MAG TPA: hypothetical protein VHN81_02950 [Edaphobacter sp.]|nr:hypothetical protein [Edaphobacter sp.]
MTLRKLLFATALFATPLAVLAQEGPLTQAIVTVTSKSPQTLTAQNLKVRVNNHPAQVTAVEPVKPNGTQIALLIDDGLRTSIGRQLSDMKSFITSLPDGTEILIGYMQNGRVIAQQPFTTDHSAAAANLRLPVGSPGLSASPYFCLSDFVKNWPASREGASDQGYVIAAKARFIIMITNGVDPYNGSVSPMNQNSVYVDASIRDAQRAGVPVYSIYYSNAGIRGGAASFSGQSYLAKVSDETGGQAYFQGMRNPVSLSPFFERFSKSVAESYVATFPAPAKTHNNLISLKFSSTLGSTKLQSARYTRPGISITATSPSATRE